MNPTGTIVTAVTRCCQPIQIRHRIDRGHGGEGRTTRRSNLLRGLQIEIAALPSVARNDEISTRDSFLEVILSAAKNLRMPQEGDPSLRSGRQRRRTTEQLPLSTTYYMLHASGILFWTFSPRTCTMITILAAPLSSKIILGGSLIPAAIRVVVKSRLPRSLRSLAMTT